MNDAPPQPPIGSDAPAPARPGWRGKLHEIIFEADTPTGKFFDVALLIAIVLSVLAVILETVEALDREYHTLFIVVEWTFTILFTIEYGLRLVSVLRPMRYATSFFGVVDLLAILPAYIALLIPGTQSLMVIRALRILRVFRVFKLARYLSEAHSLAASVRAARAKIAVFLVIILITVVIMGAAMHLIEGSRPESKFTSIPVAMYWAVVTMTTVGYGDIVPQTPLGEFLAALMIIMGYCLIIVPTGIISAEFVHQSGGHKVSTQHCPHCSREGHERDAKFCKFCGGKL